MFEVVGLCVAFEKKKNPNYSYNQSFWTTYEPAVLSVISRQANWQNIEHALHAFKSNVDPKGLRENRLQQR